MSGSELIKATRSTEQFHFAFFSLFPSLSANLRQHSEHTISCGRRCSCLAAAHRLVLPAEAAGLLSTACRLADENELVVGVANSRRGGNGRPEVVGTTRAQCKATRSVAPDDVLRAARTHTRYAYGPFRAAAGAGCSSSILNVTRAVSLIFHTYPAYKLLQRDKQTR